MTPCVPAYQEIRISVLPLSATVVGSLSVIIEGTYDALPMYEIISPSCSTKMKIRNILD